MKTNDAETQHEEIDWWSKITNNESESTIGSPKGSNSYGDGVTVIDTIVEGLQGFKNLSDHPNAVNTWREEIKEYKMNSLFL